jgi:hypothetical protein
MDGPDPLRSNSVPFIIDEFTRHDYEIVCEQPEQCQVLRLTLDQCIPVDGPRKLVIEFSQVVPHQTFMYRAVAADHPLEANTFKFYQLEVVLAPKG